MENDRPLPLETIEGKIMPRTLKPGPRPFIAFSILFGLALLYVLYLGYAGVAKDAWVSSAQAGLGLLCIYAVLCVFIARLRLVVGADYIAYRPSLGAERKAAFQEILVSYSVTLAEPDHPVRLVVCADTGLKTDAGEIVPETLFSIPLKSFRKSDAQWLISLPELKVEKKQLGFFKK